MTYSMFFPQKKITLLEEAAHQGSEQNTDGQRSALKVSLSVTCLMISWTRSLAV